MIELGLARISRLLKHTQLSWRAIHVAGTNGKGSICAYASAMLKASNVNTGRFTSPHIIDRWDCIAINDQPISESIFKDAEDRVKWWDRKDGIHATEFELLTATAFEIFAREKIDIGVVEVGMGGRLDATNILENPFVTVLSKIGLDHQEFLGNTLEAITREKAGILKPCVPCVIDSTNEESVKTVIKDIAENVGATPLRFIDQDAFEGYKQKASERHGRLSDDQLANYECANQAVMLALEQLGQSLEGPAQDYALFKSNPLPGRMQWLDISSITGHQREILLDGAHNPQSAALLGKHVDDWLRSQYISAVRNSHSQKYLGPVTWVLAMREGKAIAEILAHLIKPGDKIVTTAFGPVDGMPWVKAKSPESLLEAAAQSCTIDEQSGSKDNVAAALSSASILAGEGPLVVAGSLYLVGDVLRVLRDLETSKVQN